MRYGYNENSIKCYIRDVQNVKLLSREEERELLKKYKLENDQKAFAKLVTANWRFVLSIANKYKSCGVPLADIIQEGNIGLIVALQKYDISSEFRLLSYAVWYIRAYINKFVERNYSIVSSGHGHDLRLQLFSFKKADQAKQKKFFLKDERLDAASPEDGRRNGSLLDYANDRAVEKINNPTPEELYLIEEEALNLKKTIEASMNGLKDKDKQIIKERYLQEETKSLQAIGDERNISRERVRQIEEKALSKMKNHLQPI